MAFVPLLNINDTQQRCMRYGGGTKSFQSPSPQTSYIPKQNTRLNRRIYISFNLLLLHAISCVLNSKNKYPWRIVCNCMENAKF